jgi:hypothetical protein
MSFGGVKLVVANNEGAVRHIDPFLQGIRGHQERRATASEGIKVLVPKEGQGISDVRKRLLSSACHDGVSIDRSLDRMPSPQSVGHVATADRQSDRIFLADHGFEGVSR